MVSLLKSPAAQKIDFTLDGFHVDGLGLMFVAIALLSKSQGKQHGFQISVGHVGHGFEATYASANNTFDFPSAGYGTTPFQKMMIIHECVHARRDCSGGQLHTSTGLIKTTSLSDEAAAYVAGALFDVYEEAARGLRMPFPPSWTQGDAVYDTAFTIALKLREKRGDAVDPNDSKTLREAIMNDPHYQHLKLNPLQTYPNNGVSL